MQTLGKMKTCLQMERDLSGAFHSVSRQRDVKSKIKTIGLSIFLLFVLVFLNLGSLECLIHVSSNFIYLFISPFSCALLFVQQYF